MSARPNTGALASAAWLVARGLFPDAPRWSVTVTLTAPANDALQVAFTANFTIEIFAEEWGFALRRADQQSWIRVTDMPFVHGSDDFELLRRTPRLQSIAKLMREIEREQGIRFDRRNPTITSSFGNEETIAAWARSL